MYSVFSNSFIKGVYEHIEKELEPFSLPKSSGIMPNEDSFTLVETKVRADSSKSGDLSEMGNEKKKKKGKSTVAKTAESLLDDEEYVSSKSRRNQRKGKDISSSKVSDTKGGGKKDSVKNQDDYLNVPSEDWVMQKILALVPEFAEQGLGDPETILIQIAGHLRPMLINSLKERRKAVLTENAERMKRLLDNLQKKLDESFLIMQLYEKALDLFDDDQSTSIILHRHLLRTTAASITCSFIIWT